MAIILPQNILININIFSIFVFMLVGYMLIGVSLLTDYI